jgi:NHLM bacteriocin system ABC transporter ATP-binding protein
VSPDILQLFEAEGTPQELAGHTPLLLGDLEAVWLVAAGRVDVFAVGLEKGRPVSARVHLFRAVAGQALFGMGLEGSPASKGLLVVGVSGTGLLRLPRARLGQLTGEAGVAEQVGRLVEGWVWHLTAAVSTGFPPKQCTLLEPGREVSLEPATRLCSGAQIVWVRHLEGSSCFAGWPELTLSPDQGPFPLAGNAWLEATDPGRLTAAPTRAVLGESSLWSGLERFHQVILACLVWKSWDANAANRERLWLQADADRRLAEAALERLAEVAAPAADEADAAVTADPLLWATQLVGHRLGIAIQAPPGWLRGRGMDGEQAAITHPSPPTTDQSSPHHASAVAAIARASRVRLRRVLLQGDWWRQDSGPLLAFTHDQQPVALLPSSPTGYDLADPVSGVRIPVTADIAAELAPFAHTFYRPFPARALRVGDLAQLGLAGCGKDLRTVLLLSLMGALLSLLPPIATGVVVETIIPSGDRGQLLLVLLGLAVAAIAAGLFEITRNIAILRVESRADAAVEAALWDRLLGLPVSFFRRFTAGDLAGRALGLAAIRQLLTGATVTSLLGGVFSLCSLGLLFVYDLSLAALALVLLLALLGTTALTGYGQLRFQRPMYQLRGKVAGLVLQLITGIARLRVAGAEERALALWATQFSTQRRLTFRARSVANTLAVVQSAVPLLVAVALFALAAARLRAGLSVGAFLAFNAAFGQALAGAIALGAALNAVLRVIPLFERLRPILEAAPEVDPARPDPGELTGAIEVSHVSFRYQPDGPLILDDVSLQARPGEFVAVVGPSGSGKSTLFRLLLGFDAPQAGSIYLDSRDLAGLDLQAVRRQLGVVLQTSKVIAGAILTNILGGKLLTLENAWEAARLSGLEDDIKQMPMGMHTVIPEGGQTLSGGQRQRLLIARAVASWPRILLMDEATSALDNRTQAMVSQSLEQLKATRLVIAHRLSTVCHADRIYVMQAGRVVQQGSYEDLARQPGLFAELVKRQLA